MNIIELKDFMQEVNRIMMMLIIFPLLALSVSVMGQTNSPEKKLLISDCRVFSKTTQANYYYEFENSEFYRQLIALCKNDVMAYYRKDNLDDLDMALYKKSEGYKTDLNNFNKNKNEKMALIFPFEPLSEPRWEFTSNGFSYRVLETKSFEQKNCLRFMDLIIPINSNLAKSNDDWHFFKCNNLEKLQELRANKDNVEVLFIFKAGKAAISAYWSTNVKDYVYILNPVALYMMNKTTGDIIIDLSNCLRKTGIDADKQRIEAASKTKLNARKKTYHSKPKQIRCSYCSGRGYYEQGHVTGPSTKERCEYCYGKGYTMEYYY